MAKLLATKKMDVTHNKSTSFETYLACRLIPLDEKPGVRPIGIKEVLRRVIGKSVIYAIKWQIVQSAGHLQLCACQQAGCESAVHAMSYIFAEEETDALLLVDATNAFNHRQPKNANHTKARPNPLLAGARRKRFYVSHSIN